MMGNANVRVYPEKEFPTRDLFDAKDDNGYRMASGVQLNDDVLTMVLSHLPPEYLVSSCRLVCKNWCDLIDSEVWKAKLHRSPYRSYAPIRNLPWHLIYWVLKKNCLHRNLVLNPSGEGKLTEWNVLSNGGDKWRVETPPQGTEDPAPHTSCFATSFRPCIKEQVIDLAKVGAVPALMDCVQPHITVSEWCAGRWDCRSVYELEVNLVKASGDVVDEFRTKEYCGGERGCAWKEVRHTFQNYGQGVRYVRFWHSGTDEQFWAGHYGSKMAGAQVKLTLPTS